MNSGSSSTRLHGSLQSFCCCRGKPQTHNLRSEHTHMNRHISKVRSYNIRQQQREVVQEGKPRQKVLRCPTDKLLEETTQIRWEELKGTSVTSWVKRSNRTHIRVQREQNFKHWWRSGEARQQVLGVYTARPNSKNGKLFSCSEVFTVTVCRLSRPSRLRALSAHSQ